MYYPAAELEVLIGKVLTNVENVDNQEVFFTTVDGKKYVLYHEQDCCEYVRVEDIIGDLSDLIGTPILMAELVTNESDPTTDGAYGTWSFYKFATVKGYVTIRWLGESDGYYSETVTFAKCQ